MMTNAVDHRLAALLGLTLLLSACATPSAKPNEQGAAKMETFNAGVNPLLSLWKGPWGGVPPFGSFNAEDFRGALESAMAETLREVERIATQPSPPTFENTIVALERSDRTLDRVASLYGVYTSTMNDDPMQAVEREMAPKLAAFFDQVIQNSRLFARVAAVYEIRDRLQLTPEQRRLLWRHYTTFARAGAKLDDAGKRKLSEYNQRLAELFTTFSQNVLAEEGSQMVLIEHEQ